jgi:hypothetical protein
MARCYACDEEIGYLAFFAGTFKYLGRNMWRRTLPVFDCPRCGTECQERASTAYGFAGVAATVGVIAAIALRRPHAAYGVGALIFGILVPLIVAHVAWWRWVSQLKEPHQFFWE